MRQTLFAIALAFSAMLLWLALRDVVAPGLTTATAPAAVANPAPADALVGGSQDESDASEPPPTKPKEVAEARDEVAPPPKQLSVTVTLRGRCVDKDGEPMAGCVTKIHGWGANSERMDAYLKNHDKVVWKDPESQTTGADGCFEISFVPPPPYQFTLGIKRPTSVEVNGRWSKLTPGTVKDFGDIAMLDGSKVHGILADSNGVPQSKVRIYMNQYNRPRQDKKGELYHRRNYYATSQADGNFAFPGLVAAGTWDLDIRGRQMLTPKEAVIRAGEPETMLRIESKPLGEIKTLTGIVVDANGQPVQRAYVSYQPSRGGGGWINSTKRDGTFRIERKDGDPDGPIQISLRVQGFESLASKERYTWGTAGIRLVMKAGLAVEVLVTDAKTGEPIEDYGVRCFPDPKVTGMRSSLDQRMRGAGRHEGGRLMIEGIVRGPQILIVVPKGNAYATSRFIYFEVGQADAPLQEVTLDPNVTRLLRVTSAGGEPVADTAVELLRPIGSSPVTMVTRAIETSNLMNYYNDKRGSAALITKGKTDASGVFEMIGPEGRKLAVRVLGPGHQAMVENGITLAADQDPLVLVVDAGATVKGLIGPAAMIAQLRLLAGDHRAPTVSLRLTVGNEVRTFPPGHEGLAVAADGTFEMTGVPPGTWEVHLGFSISHGSRTWHSASEPAGTLTNLRDGEVRKFKANLPGLIPGTISGKVTWNGKPAVGAHVQLMGKKADGRGGERSISGGSTKLDSEGAFSMLTMPATYNMQVSIKSKAGDWISLPAKNPVALGPNEKLNHTFAVETGQLRVRVLGSKGAPMTGMRIRLATGDASWSGQSPPTDAKGECLVENVPIGQLVLAILPKELMDPKARQAFFAANRGNPTAWRDAMIELGRVSVEMGQEPTEIEVTVPALAGY